MRLVSADQARELAPDMRKVAQTDPFGRGPTCLLSSNATTPYYSIITSPTETIATFEGNNQSRISVPTTIQGFAAVTVQRPNDPNGCLTVVDIADGQSLITIVDNRTGISVDEICAASDSLTNTAMASLLAQP